MVEEFIEWSPDGSRAAFTSWTDATDAAIWLVDTTGTRELLTQPGWGATWSPDGSRLAFWDGHSLWTINVDGSDRAILVGDVGAGDVAWSPDGTRIGYALRVLAQPAECEIWVVGADGSGPRRVVDGTAFRARPAWSPDARRIAFASVTSEWNRVIAIANVDTGEQTDLTVGPHDAHPAWSPDGGRIAYDSGGDVWVVGVDGSDRQSLTNSVHADLWPSWSPDGRHIAFASDRGGTADIYVMSADGGRQTAPITTSGRWEYHPQWSPDGRHIAYVSSPSPAPFYDDEATGSEASAVHIVRAPL